MKSVVTGGSGFLGRAVVAHLLEIGHDVRVLDNNSRGNSQLLNKEIDFRQIDMRDKDAVIRHTKNVDLIVHLAFVNGTRYFYEKPDLVTEVGIKGMVNVHDAIIQNDISQLITFSTSEVYQEASVIPTPEEVSLIIPNIMNPRYSYGGAKIASELITVQLTSKYLENWKVIRPHNIYGPNMGNEHVVPELFSKIMASKNSELLIQGSGDQTRAFCEISDFKHAFEVVLKDSSNSGIYNIGTRDEVSIIKLAQKIIETTSKPNIQIITSKANSGEASRRCPDISKIEKLGFTQKITLDMGLKKYFEQMFG